MNDKYINITSSTFCYKIKKLLPKRFHNVDLKLDEKYKKWKEAEDKKFNNKIKKLDNEVWWNNLDEKDKKELIKGYGTKEIACSRRWRFIATFSCSWKEYKYFNNFLEIKKIFELLDLEIKKRIESKKLGFIPRK
jgi:hypothetical protein